MKWKPSDSIEVDFYTMYSPDHLRDVRQYLQGYIKALQDFGLWRDGQRTIGALNHPIHIAFAWAAYDLDEVKNVTYNGEKLISLK